MFTSKRHYNQVLARMDYLERENDRQREHINKLTEKLDEKQSIIKYLCAHMTKDIKDEISSRDTSNEPELGKRAKKLVELYNGADDE